MPHQRLRLIAFVGFILIFGTWARFYLTDLRVKSNPTSEPDLAQATEAAQPLLEALKKYRADNGLYPTALNQLTPAYLPSLSGLRGFRYSARRGDWVLKSDACAAREQSLRGWVLKEAKEYQKEVAEFKLECINGYHHYQLQSGDFPQDPQSNRLERWAYYDSQSNQWNLGWCSHKGGRKQEIGMNGVCRWRDGGKSEPW
jgi:hypothetical protein